jgi:hypothetical protein
MRGHPQAALEAATRTISLALGGSFKAEGFGDGFFHGLKLCVRGAKLAPAMDPAGREFKTGAESRI